MSDPFIGQISVFPYGFAPVGYLECNGQLEETETYSALFSVIGMAFGGNGTKTFGIPNLNGSVPLGAGTGPGLTQRIIGETGGKNEVSLAEKEMPAHKHFLSASTENTNSEIGANHLLGDGGASYGFYAGAQNTNPVKMNPASLQVTGAGSPHENRQPYLCFRFCIATEGEYPERPV